MVKRTQSEGEEDSVFIDYIKIIDGEDKKDPPRLYTPPVYVVYVHLTDDEDKPSFILYLSVFVDVLCERKRAKEKDSGVCEFPSAERAMRPRDREKKNRRIARQSQGTWPLDVSLSESSAGRFRLSFALFPSEVPYSSMQKSRAWACYVSRMYVCGVL